jgi:predicted site-specific integrase-resolvase
MKNETEYVKTEVAMRHFGISYPTIRRWEAGGKIESIKTNTGQRLYRLESAYSSKTVAAEREDVIYIRVSSDKQRDDLERQRSYMLSRFPNTRIISDIGSGINYKRKGLLSLLEQAKGGKIKRVLVATKDRLSRFGIELIEWLFSSYGVELVVLEQTSNISTEEELANDLLSIVQVFCCRRNGKRRYNNKNVQTQVKPDQGTETVIEEI